MNLLPGLAAACCPVLVMAGAQDPVCPLEDSLDIAAALPAAWSQLAVFDGSGHGAWRDEPDAAFARLRELRERLTEVERLYLERLMKTRDANEGLTAFIERRTPTWEHR